MLAMLNLVIDRVRALRGDQRGVVSVEWIILGAVVMAAIVLAFSPQFQTALTNAVTAIGTQLQTQVNAAGS